MKKYFKFMFLAVFALALVACEKEVLVEPEIENEPEKEAGNQKWLLAEEKIDGITKYAYEYNDQNQMTARHYQPNGGSVSSEYFAYNTSGNLIRVERKSEGKLVVLENYYYELGDKPARAVFKTAIGKITEFTFSYGDNFVTKRFNFNMDSKTYTFDSKGNLSKIEETGLVHFNYEYADYDDNAYRYTAHPWQWEDTSINNARVQKRFLYSYGTVLTYEEIWNYTYNEDGYPVSAEVFSKEEDKVIANYTYTYVKANKIN